MKTLTINLSFKDASKIPKELKIGSYMIGAEITAISTSDLFVAIEDIEEALGTLDSREFVETVGEILSRS